MNISIDTKSEYYVIRKRTGALNYFLKRKEIYFLVSVCDVHEVK